LRTQLAQAKKWPAMVGGKMTALCKVINVSPTGDNFGFYNLNLGALNCADSLDL